MSRPRLLRPVSVPKIRQFNDTLLPDVHFWNYQGREVLVYSQIDEATRFHDTPVLPSQSTRDLYEVTTSACVKWGRSFTPTDHTWLGSSLKSWERKLQKLR